MVFITTKISLSYNLKRASTRSNITPIIKYFAFSLLHSRFCATRRSAGIPYLIQALVTTEPKNRNYQSLELALNNLLSFCEDPREELRIHAYNILRSLYRDSSLGEVVSPYISKGLQVSILGFKAHTWPVSPS